MPEAEVATMFFDNLWGLYSNVKLQKPKSTVRIGALKLMLLCCYISQLRSVLISLQQQLCASKTNESTTYAY